MSKNSLKKRASGVLLHITSLPGKYGNGDMGISAYRFVDFLQRSGQNYWQVLAVNPVFREGGYSPYKALSAFAGNTLLISPEMLYKEGFIEKKDLQDCPRFPKNKVNFDKARRYKFKILDKVFKKYKRIARRKSFQKFCGDNKFWLGDYALFSALRKHFNGKTWNEFPKEIRDRKPDSLRDISKKLRNEINREKLEQYLFFRQWYALKRYCNNRNIKIIGDAPIYVDMESADVWANPKLFKLAKSKKPKFIAGVPPDLFSSTGQLWGNPVYNWTNLKKDNYHWWIQRLKHNLDMCDLLRLDHFRGFAGYWQVPAGHKTARRGRWVKAPGEDFLKTVTRKIPNANIIAEDLGYITEDVKKLIAEFGFPSMKILQFAFDGDTGSNQYAPHNLVENCIVYTGTHDNNTSRGWFENELDNDKKETIREYTGRNVNSKNVSWVLIRMAMGSVSKLSIIPVQDLLSLGGSCRMNNPAKNTDNWRWRLSSQKELDKISDELKGLTGLYGRGN
jgi:4-alpha-glucanotransferase